VPDAVAARLRRLPELDGAVFETDSKRHIDEWPARLQGIVAQPERAPFVVSPADTDGVTAVLRWASRAGAKVQALGAGSNVVGAVDPSVDVLISLERINNIEINVTDHTVTAGAGRRGRDVEEELRTRGFCLGHYPQSLHISTVGGWIATRATGTYSAFYGGIERLLVGAQYVDATGRIVRIAPRPRASGGLDLLGLLCGSEGSLGIITEATLAISRILPERRVCAGARGLASGLAIHRELAQSGIPLGLARLYNSAEGQHVAEPNTLKDGECLLVVTTLGPESVAEAGAAEVQAIVTGAGARPLPAATANRWFANRYASSGFMADRNQDASKIFDTVEVALPWSTVVACAEELEDVLAKLSKPFYQHFSHVYSSGVCLYALLFIDGDDREDARMRWHEAWRRTLDLVAQYGGTLAHHHGIGVLRSGRYAKTAEADVHRRLRAAIDPQGVLAAPCLNSAGSDLLASDGIAVGGV
jgi:alkyldihydroxyacetonephosphate synthase